MVSNFYKNTLAVLTILGSVVAAAIGILPALGTEGTASISGVVFEDANRDGVHDSEEDVFAELMIYLVRGESLVATAVTGVDGGFGFPSVPVGEYTVMIAGHDWRDYWTQWVPTTTGTLEPHLDITADQVGVEALLGIRRIERSSDLDQPLSSSTGDSGVRVNSYVDAVSAQEVLEELESGTLLGPEAQYVTVHFGFSDFSQAASSGGVGGDYFKGDLWLSYPAWADRQGHVLFHEYGHIWAEYHDRITQADGTLAGYLDARGITGDPRIDSNKSWQPMEMIADDYRLLFGSPSARVQAHMNTDLPAPTDVPGLRQWFLETFTQAPVGDDPSSGEDDPAPSDDADPPAPGDPSPDGDVAAPLTLTDLSAVAGGAGVTIEGTVSRPATVTVRILDHRGRVIRTVSVGEVAAIDVNWDLHDDRGRKVKDGVYVVEVVGEDSGEVATAQVTADVATATEPTGRGRNKG